MVQIHLFRHYGIIGEAGYHTCFASRSSGFEVRKVHLKHFSGVNQLQLIIWYLPARFFSEGDKDLSESFKFIDMALDCSSRQRG